MSTNLTEAQRQFLSNVTRPITKPKTDELHDELSTRYPRYQNITNIIHGVNIFDYIEYLQEKCNKLCLFKVMPDYKKLYQTNSLIKNYIDDKCKKCITKLETFHRAFDNALKKVHPTIDPGSPTTQFNLQLLLLEKGDDIFNAINVQSIRGDLKKFEPLDEGEWRKEIAQTELDLKAFIKQEEGKKKQRVSIIKRGVNRFRGGKKSKKKRKRSKRKRSKRKQRKKTRKKLLRKV